MISSMNYEVERTESKRLHFGYTNFPAQHQTIYVKKCKVNAKRFQQLSLLANYTQIPQKTNKRVTLQWLWRPPQVSRMVKTHSCPCNLKSSRNVYYYSFTMQFPHPRKVLVCSLNAWEFQHKGLYGQVRSYVGPVLVSPKKNSY